MRKGPGAGLAESAAPYRLVSNEDGLAIAEVEPLCLVVWTADLTLARFQRYEIAARSFVERNTGRAGIVHVMGPSVAPVERHMRKAPIDLVSELGSRLRCTAVVVPGSGFRAAAARSVLSSIVLLMPKGKTEIAFKATFPAALQWIQQRCECASTTTVGMTEAYALFEPPYDAPD